MDYAGRDIEQGLTNICRAHCSAAVELKVVSFLACLDGALDFAHFLIEPQRSRPERIGSQKENLHWQLPRVQRSRE